MDTASISLPIKLLTNDGDGGSKARIISSLDVRFARLLFPSSTVCRTASRFRCRGVDTDKSAEKANASDSRARVIDLLIELIDRLAVECYLEAELGNNDELNYTRKSFNAGWCVVLEFIVSVLDVPIVGGQETVTCMNVGWRTMLLARHLP
jgi:hypothetical protein